MPVYDALIDFEEQITHILPRHEQGAIHAAEGYARIKRQTGVCMATSGPGATNLITGLCDAQLDSLPIVAITGQVPGFLLGSDAFQEVDVVNSTIPVTKWNYQITKPEEIGPVFKKAFFIANSGPPRSGGDRHHEGCSTGHGGLCISRYAHYSQLRTPH